MPDGSPYLILHVFDEAEYARLTLVGPRSISTNVNPKDRMLTIAIKFIPGALGGVVPFSLHDLIDQSIPFGIFHPNMHEILYHLNSWGRTFQINKCIIALEQLLMAALFSRHIPPNKTVSRGVQLIYNSFGSKEITEAANMLDISNRHLTNLFRKNVGLSPKKLSRIVRINQTVKYADDHGYENWASIAYKNNFYDQSHLIEDFNSLLRENPEKFINRSNREKVF